MRSLLALCGTFLIVVGLVAPGAIVAAPSMLDAFRGQYPATVGGKLDTCATCHATASGGPLNPYGVAYSNGFNFAAIESQDSDGDGYTNIQEINGLTFPGDATDFPSGGGGDSRVAGRGTLSTGVDALMASVATDTLSGNVLAVWTQASDSAASSAAATVQARLAKGDASETGKVVSLGSADGDDTVALAYGGKFFVAAWSDGTDVVARSLKAKNGKALKGPITVAQNAADAAVAWDAGLKRFLVASSTGDGSQINQVSTKGKVTARLNAGAPELLPDVGWPLGFATGDSGDGLLLLGVDASGAKSRPLGAQVVNGMLENVSSGYGKLSKNDPQAAGSFAVASEGVVAWRDGTKLMTGAITADGGLVGKALTQKGIAASMVAVAVQPDGIYLVVWTDAKTGMVMAADMDAAGNLIGDPFELQDTGETADPAVLSATAVEDGVLVVYATSGASGEVRSVLVGPR